MRCVTLSPLSNIGNAFHSALHIPRRLVCLPCSSPETKEHSCATREKSHPSTSQSDISCSSENDTPPPSPRRWNAGPILTYDQLQVALSREELALEEQKEQLEPMMTIPSLKRMEPPSDASSEIYFRPLSPPPEHFRRRKSQRVSSHTTKSKRRESLSRIFNIGAVDATAQETVPAKL